MREHVVARVVDQLDLREGVGAAVVGELFAGVEQHLADARGRADLLDRVAPLRHTRGRGAPRLRGATAAVVPAKAHALAGQADVAQDAGEIDDGPVRHLAMVGPLNGPGGAQLGALGGHQLGQRADLGSGDAGDFFGPLGGFGGAAVLAFQVGAVLVKAHGVLVDEGLVVFVLAEQVVAHGHEQGRVGVGDDAHPFRTHFFVGSGYLRVDRDELAAGLFDGIPAGIHFVVAHRVLSAVVLVGVAADEHHQLGVVAQLLPGGLGRVHLHVANHHGQKNLPRARRVVARGDGGAAQQVEKAPLQHVGAENARVRPAAIGAGEAAFVAVFFDGVQDGLGRQAQGRVPAHLHPLILAAQLGLVAAFAPVLFPLQVGLAHHGPGNAGFVVGAVQHTFGQHGRGHFVAGLGLDLDDTAFFDCGQQGAVVGGVGHHAAEGL